MEPFVTHRGRVAVLDWTDVNTDLIIPARYLKRIERTGYGPLLFADKRYVARRRARRSTTPRRTAPRPPTSPEPPRAAGRDRSWSSAATSAAARAASTPSGPSPRPAIRAVIAPGKGEGFADIFEGNAFNNGLLPIELPDADWQAIAEAARAPAGPRPRSTSRPRPSPSTRRTGPTSSSRSTSPRASGSACSRASTRSPRPCCTTTTSAGTSSRPHRGCFRR